MQCSKLMSFLKKSSNSYQKRLLFQQRNFDSRCSARNLSPVIYQTRYESTTPDASKRKKLKEGPSLQDFLAKYAHQEEEEANITQNEIPYLSDEDVSLPKGKVYFDVKGCQMNVNDAEIAWSIMKDAGYSRVDTLESADIILLVTCSIRENAENKIWDKLNYIRSLKTRQRKNAKSLRVGVLGCMAERLKEKLLERERCVDVVAGPDSYRDLPRLLTLTENNQKAVNVLLSLDETYADITPVRLNKDPISAYVSIMRGCENMCSYCIVPFTRGRERSRPVESILREVQELSEQGIKCVTLLGQNVNSYCDRSAVNHFGGLGPTEATHMAKGFKTVYKPKLGGTRFADLLDKISQVDPEMRIQYTSPHPKDFPDEVLELVRDRRNISTWVHLPAQSGNNQVLERMRRGYTREAYMDLVARVREIIPNVSLTSDFIAGFCGETEDQFQDTLSLFEEVPYTMAFLFAYSMREKTTAHRRYVDDVPQEIKMERQRRMTEAYTRTSINFKKSMLGSLQVVLVEGPNRQSQDELCGRNEGNIKVIFSNKPIPDSRGSEVVRAIKPGDYVIVQVDKTRLSLVGTALYHTTLSEGSRIVDISRQQQTTYCH